MEEEVEEEDGGHGIHVLELHDRSARDSFGLKVRSPGYLYQWKEPSVGEKNDKTITSDRHKTTTSDRPVSMFTAVTVFGLVCTLYCVLMVTGQLMQKEEVNGEPPGL